MSGDFSRKEYQERLARLRDAMRKADVVAMLIDDAEILAYYTGHERSVSFYRACIVPLSGEPLMVLRSLDVAPFEEACWFKGNLAYADTEDAVGAVARGMSRMGLAEAAIGFDSGSHAMSVDVYQRLCAALPGARFVALPGLPWELRLRKSPAEITLTRRAAAIADTVMGEIATRARAGSTEREWSAYAARRFIELGGMPGHVGPITVGRGWGFLHGHLHDTPLRKGDILHLELVPRFHGYSARLMCVSAWQKGPRWRGDRRPKGTPLVTGFTMALGMNGGLDRDAGRGDGREDPAGVFSSGQRDQGDLPRTGCVAEGCAEGCALGGDGVPLRA